MTEAGQPASTPWWRRAGAGARRARRERRSATGLLYARLVAKARDPFLFRDLEVPDTREGRLELVMLHAMLVMRRLAAEGEPGRQLAQSLFDLMFADVDRHLREWGVGDLSVGKRVKAVAQSFFARAAAFEQGLAAGDAGELVPILERNVWQGDDGGTGRGTAAEGLARYLLAQAGFLDRQGGAALLAGEVAFEPARAASLAPPGGGDGPGG